MRLGVTTCAYFCSIFLRRFEVLLACGNGNCIASFVHYEARYSTKAIFPMCHLGTVGQLFFTIAYCETRHFML